MNATAMSAHITDPCAQSRYVVERNLRHVSFAVKSRDAYPT